jgi:ankyrin repeat/SAM/basic leucine zipper domain-containing protein 1
MARKLNIKPAGFSSDEDSSDEEGFSYAGPIELSRTRKQVQAAPVSDGDLLRMAALNGDVPVLKSLIEEKTMPVDSILQGWTPLMFAASNCEYDAMEYLIDKGASPNFHQNCYTVLMTACACRKQIQDICLKCVRLLLDSGALVNSRQRNGMTPLMMACREGMVKIVDELIKRNADINAQDVMGWTPLIWSVHHSKQSEMEIISLLISAGADVSIKCGRGQTAHAHALSLGYHHIAVQIPSSDGDVPVTLTTECAVPKADLWEDLKDNLCGINGNKWVLWRDIARILDQLGMFQSYGHRFKESEMDFVKFLTLTEDELEALSVLPVHRICFLNKIRKLHLKPWKHKSLDLRSIKNMQREYRMVDEIKFIANVARQISMIRASITYVRIHTSPSFEGEPHVKVEDLYLTLESTLNKANALHKELKSYESFIASSLCEEKYPPDWFGPDTHRKKLRCPLMATSVAVVVIGIIVWKTYPYLIHHSNIKL